MKPPMTPKRNLAWAAGRPQEIDHSCAVANATRWPRPQAWTPSAIDR
jgi:hypothetical protein